MPRQPFAPLVAAAALLVIGSQASCSDEPTRAALPALPDCSGALDVTVEQTIEGVEFSWTPACRLTSLSVEFAHDPPLVAWSVHADRPYVAPPLRYGEVPSGATQSVGPLELDPGRTYRVRLRHYGGGDMITAHGETTFTP